MPESEPSPFGVALCHPGMQHAPWLAEQLERVGLLREFWTGVGASDRGWLGRWLGSKSANPLARLLAKRTVRNVPASKLHLRPSYELVAALKKRMRWEEQGFMHTRNAGFQAALPERVFRDNAFVIGFDTAGWILGQRCRAHGARFVLDQSIAHPVSKERVYARVRRDYPAWAENLEYRLPKVLAAETSEQGSAARVVVASSFTQRTLVENGVPAGKITINPYGVELTRFGPAGAPRSDRPFRFVFVGQITARKGIPLLLETWNALAPKAELWLVGHVSPRVRPLVAGYRNVILKGAVPHSQIPAVLRECDVFVFPSFFEGFGLVLLEAMACGLPVIATDATGAPDVLVDGGEGFVIRSGDGQALAQRLQYFLADPTRAAAMGRAARATAQRFTWNAYGDRWQKMLVDAWADGNPSVT